MTVRKGLGYASEWERFWGTGADRKPMKDVVVVSLPPPGKCKVVNIYYDPNQDRMVVEYDDEPK